MGRRQKRYERRQIEREIKRNIKLYNASDFESVAGEKSLYNAAWKSAKGVKWKASVQKYLLNIFSNIYKTKKALLEGKDVRRGFIEFDICERGKQRHIRSVHFQERVVQKTLCANALYPVLTRNLITDNGASQKGKGMHYATNRLVNYLRKHYKRYGNEGYILVIDFKSYFDNVNHEKLKEIYKKNFENEDIIKLAYGFIDVFGEKGLGLGSETSQISAVAYINSIDHYIKEVAKIKGYGRYMDDSYIIHHSKEYLEELLEKLQILYKEYGIKLNEKKTHITKLKSGFTFLKTRVYLTETGKVVKKPCRDSITRERRRLKRQAKLVEKGVLNIEQVNQSYQSWRGSMNHRNARRTVFNMQKLYDTLFSKGVEK